MWRRPLAKVGGVRERRRRRSFLGSGWGSVTGWLRQGSLGCRIRGRCPRVDVRGGFVRGKGKWAFASALGICIGREAGRRRAFQKVGLGRTHRNWKVEGPRMVWLDETESPDLMHNFDFL